MIQPTGNSTHQRTQAGYTLLELLLSLALSVVVVVAIGMAIQVYLIALTKQQNLVERKQLVRSVVTMIGNDLRAGIQYKAADYSGFENIIATQQTLLQLPTEEELAQGGLELLEQLVPGESSEGESSEGESSEGESSEGESSEGELVDSGIIVEEEVSFRPTMLGTDRVIMLDISRLPRLDQYNPLVASDGSTTRTPSDIKSIAYFVSLSGGGVEEEIQFAAGALGGLYRREIDRAVAAYMGEFSLIAEPDEYSNLVANEIAELTFRYFDGEQWQAEWDSSAAGGFPMAIEITLEIDARRSAPQSYSNTGSERDSIETYRSVVHLPVSEPTVSEE